MTMPLGLVDLKKDLNENPRLATVVGFLFDWIRDRHPQPREIV
jgi:hypothetical protein